MDYVLWSWLSLDEDVYGWMKIVLPEDGNMSVIGSHSVYMWTKILLKYYERYHSSYDGKNILKYIRISWLWLVIPTRGQ